MLSENDKIKAYVDSSVCAYLSPYEPFGLVSLEAAACGTPVIVSAETPMSQIVNDGGFGFSVKYGDLNQLVKMLQIILNSDNLKGEMGQKGRRFVFNYFDWSKIIDKIEVIYNESLIVKKSL
jgi:glycosyltransferase involved in cell wall biosynthesis